MTLKHCDHRWTTVDVRKHFFGLFTTARQRCAKCGTYRRVL